MKHSAASAQLNKVTFDKAKRAFEGEHYQEALALFSSINQEGYFKGCHFFIARCNLELGNFKEAIQQLNELLKKDSSHKEILLIELGRVYMGLKKYKKANALYEEAVSYNGKNRADAYFYMGESYYREGKYAKAAECYRKAADLDGDIVSYMNLGDCLLKSDDGQKAADAFAAAFKTAQDSQEKSKALYGLGISYCFLEKYDDAIHVFDRIEDAGFFDNRDIYTALCNSFLGKYEAAIRIYNGVIQRNPKWAKPVYSLGNTFLDKGDKENALACFKKAVSLGGSELDLSYSYLGDYYYEEGCYKKAITCCKKSLEIYDYSADTHCTLGNCYYQLKMYNEASQEYEKALKFNKEDTDSLFFLGESYFTLGRTDDALKAFLKCHKISPEDVDCMEEVAACYKKLNQIDNCIKWSRKILKLQPENKLANWTVKKYKAAK